MKTWTVLLILSSLVSFQASSEGAWSKLIEEDVNHIYTTVKSNHPGYVDSENAYFKKWLEQGYQEALLKSKNAKTLNDVLSILKTYVAGFADGHFYLYLDYRATKIKWAGIEIKRFGNDYRVSYSDRNHSSLMPENMSKLLSCDNRLVEHIISEDVLKYRFNATDLNSPKVWYAAEILIDDGIGKRTHFKSCKFESNGKIKDINLSWSNISHSSYVNKVLSETPPAKKFNFESLGNNKYWVTLPKFYPNKEEQKALRDVIDKIKNVNGSASRFIIDVRGNGGGNSEWGIEVAKAVYGEDFIKNHQLYFPDNSYALWRVSSDNAKYIEEILPWLEEQFGKESEMLVDFTKLSNDMKTALEQGETFVKQVSYIDDRTISSATHVPTASKATVLLLTDSSCGSACLDFADLMLKLPNVYHVGQETGADTVYMDIRYASLPSDLGNYSLAQKVYRHRPRAHNESYIPEYFYNADISDTEKLKNWIGTLPIK